ncbi:hypothetical protein L1887_11989 [Cichorium endivia]|nr:hypothetical protein L1887_11989 [Cichorium endivia]
MVPNATIAFMAFWPRRQKAGQTCRLQPSDGFEIGRPPSRFPLLMNTSCLFELPPLASKDSGDMAPASKASRDSPPPDSKVGYLITAIHPKTHQESSFLFSPVCSRPVHFIFGYGFSKPNPHPLRFRSIPSSIYVRSGQ